MDDPLESGFQLVNCPGCGFDRSTPAYSGRDWVLHPTRVIHIVRCDRCGLHFTNPRPFGQKLSAYYQADYSPYQKQRGELERDSRISTALRTWVLADAYGSPDHRPTGAKRAAAQFLQLFRNREHFGFGIPYFGQGRLLDFGCGNGTFLRRMKAIGWTCTGLDFSADAVAAVKAGGIDALQGTLPHPELTGERFDAITMRHALEHVPDPRAVLLAAKDLLVSGGRLVITVPHFNSWERHALGDAALTLDLPRHLLHFTPDTLTGLVESCGYSALQVAQRSRKNWIRKSASLAEKRGTGTTQNALLRWRLFSHLAARRAERMRLGNEIVASFQKP